MNRFLILCFVLIFIRCSNPTENRMIGEYYIDSVVPMPVDSLLLPNKIVLEAHNKARMVFPDTIWVGTWSAYDNGDVTVFNIRFGVKSSFGNYLITDDRVDFTILNPNQFFKGVKNIAFVKK